MQNSSRHRRRIGDASSGLPLMHTSRKTGDVLLPSGGTRHRIAFSEISVPAVMKRVKW